MTENDAQEMAIESMVIKEHNVYFVDFTQNTGFFVQKITASLGDSNPWIGGDGEILGMFLQPSTQDFTGVLACVCVLGGRIGEDAP